MRKYIVPLKPVLHVVLDAKCFSLCVYSYLHLKQLDIFPSPAYGVCILLTFGIPMGIYCAPNCAPLEADLFRLFVFLQFSMTYVCSLSNGGGTCLYNHTGDIIHAIVHDERGIRTRMDAATSPSTAMYVVSTYCATETSLQKRSSNSTDKDYDHHSTICRFVFILL